MTWAESSKGSHDLRAHLAACGLRPSPFPSHTVLRQFPGFRPFQTLSQAIQDYKISLCHFYFRGQDCKGSTWLTQNPMMSSSVSKQTHLRHFACVGVAKVVAETIYFKVKQQESVQHTDLLLMWRKKNLFAANLSPHEAVSGEKHHLFLLFFKGRHQLYLWCVEWSFWLLQLYLTFICNIQNIA